MTDQELQELADKMRVIPRLDALKACAIGMAARGTCDDQLAPIWAEKLRHTYTTLMEMKYPELAAANGDVLPIDTSVDPADEQWEYFSVDQVGYADWISDDGEIAPNSAITGKRYTGTMENMAHEWDVTIFDLERAAKAGLQLQNMKGKLARRAHDAKTNWVWLFGDSSKNLPGLCNHPNIPMTLAALNAGTTSRLWPNKTADEIFADVAVAINAAANNTKGQYFTGSCFMPRRLMQRLRDLRLGAGDGFASAFDLLKARYSGDESGQGKVSFKLLRETGSDERTNPKTLTDDSGIAGDFLLLVPAGASKDEACFIRARPFTQLPPQEAKLKIINLSHSKIGGCKMQIPLAFHVFVFGTT